MIHQRPRRHKSASQPLAVEARAGMEQGAQEKAQRVPAAAKLLLCSTSLAKQTKLSVFGVHNKTHSGYSRC